VRHEARILELFEMPRHRRPAYWERGGEFADAARSLGERRYKPPALGIA
jgi:hypothetical protein